ncbi:M48 family metalloprotease [Nonomuraea sp. NN258]|uniref:M48 family metallopeptidase n=1 Tax=Nonomuraea antri TaxID=2730852 RepID=UPI00156866CC|nr:M48 family metallopeptidase [Nonomuraea antri]NRQ37357.1 M48 family metalloprotease [Nonomuraea antri]
MTTTTTTGPAGARVARWASYALAGVVHLLPPALLALGAYLLTRFTLLTAPIALVVIDLAWLIRPRTGRFPADAEPLTRQDAPHLFELLDRIGAESGAPRADVVAISGQVNASFGVYGARRRRLVEIGYPLWLILTPEERVALLAHEMAHSSNGDGRHGFFVGSALHTLFELRETARFRWQPGDGVSRWIGEVLLVLAGLPARILLVLFELLLYRTSQAAEYRADATAARVAGTAATGSLLDALTTRAVAAQEFLDLQLRAVGRDLWAEFLAHVQGVPTVETERLRAAAALEEWRVDVTHPPTFLRRRRVEELPAAGAAVSIADLAAVEAELERAAGRVAERLREDAGAALYL